VTQVTPVAYALSASKSTIRIFGTPNAQVGVGITILDAPSAPQFLDSVTLDPLGIGSYSLNDYIGRSISVLLTQAIPLPDGTVHIDYVTIDAITPD